MFLLLETNSVGSTEGNSVKNNLIFSGYGLSIKNQKNYEY